MIGQWKGKVGLEVLESGVKRGKRERQRRQRKRRWKEDGAEPHGLEEPQVTRDFIAGQESSEMVYLCNLSVHLVIILLTYV